MCLVPEYILFLKEKRAKLKHYLMLNKINIQGTYVRKIFLLYKIVYNTFYINAIYIDLVLLKFKYNNILYTNIRVYIVDCGN